MIAHEQIASAWPIMASPLVAGGKVFVVAGHWPIDGVFVVALDAKRGEVLWRNEGGQFRPFGTMLLADGTLVIGGFPGAAFDAERGTPSTNKPGALPPPAPPTVPPGLERILPQSAWPIRPPQGVDHPALPDLPGFDGGYVLVAGLSDGRLVRQYLRHPRSRVVAVDADAQKVETLRRQFDAEKLFDDYRLSVLVGEPERIGWPPYFATRIVSETNLPPDDALLRALRPYGGVFTSGGKTIRRDGPLPGTADWTHEFADAANSLCVFDELLKLPLGIQWYEGPAADMGLFFDGPTAHDGGDAVAPLPPGAVFAEGRMFLQGPGVLAAFDIYTGRQMWRTRLPRTFVCHGVGIHAKPQDHREVWNCPAAMEAEVPATHRCRATGFNYVAATESLYVAAGERCLRFATSDGKLLATWPMPLGAGLCWGNVRIEGDYLVATAFRPQDLVDAKAGLDGNGGDWAKDRMPMSYLMVLDRHTGKLLWRRKAAFGFLNQGMALGNGRLYCVDLLCENVLKNLKASGRAIPQAEPMILALDLETGRERWSMTTDVAVKHLSYAKHRDILLAPARTMLLWQNGEWSGTDLKGKASRGAVGKMRAIQGENGRLLWEVSEATYFEPHIVHHDLLIDRYGYTYDLLTGKRHARASPLTGESENWAIKKGGCNHLVASQNIVTWRVAFYDLAGGGAMRLLGMESGCTPSLLVSGGVLNSPNYGTRVKRARMTTLAMIHQPDNEMWLHYEPDQSAPPAPFRKVGYNFGAPGDRLAADGAMWLNVLGKSAPNVIIQPNEAATFYRRATRPDGWIASSGVIGATEIIVPTQYYRGKTPPVAQPARYTVTLYFNEPDQTTKPGDRVFDVVLQDKPVLHGFDIVHAAGKSDGEVVREFRSVICAGTLRIGFQAASAKPPVLCGVRLEMEAPDAHRQK